MKNESDTDWTTIAIILCLTIVITVAMIVTKSAEPLWLLVLAGWILIA